MKISREAWVLVAIGVLDLASTVFLVQHRVASEGNPFMAGVLKQGVWAFAAMKGLMCLAPLALLEYVRRQRPELVRNAMRVGIAGYLSLYVMVVAPQLKGYVDYQVAIVAASQPSPIFAQELALAHLHHPVLSAQRW